MTLLDVKILEIEILLFVLIFGWGVFFGICLSFMFKNFSTRIRSPSLNKIKEYLFPPKICHCGNTKNAPYCDKSHPFCFRIFRWWKWINEDLDNKRK